MAAVGFCSVAQSEIAKAALAARNLETVYALDTEEDMGQQGVSMIEMCVVIGLIAILSAASVPGWGALAARHHEHAVVKEVASELRMARQLAIARRERIRVLLNVESSSLRTECVECGNVPLRWYYFAQRGTVVESMTSRGEVVFHPSGRSATATTIVLVGPKANRSTVTVTLTGRVVIS
jgi:type IV fimbrial biogenesis protein FimT